MILQEINSGGCFSDIHNIGSDKNLDIGLQVNVPEGEVLYIENLELENVFVGIIKFGLGELRIDNLHIHHFGGDAMNIRGSNVHIENYKVHDCEPTRPYSEYHCDAILQAYDFDTKEIHSITINNLDAIIKGDQVQGIILSEAHDYFNINIKGTIQSEYPYGFVANSLRNSSIDIGDSGVKIMNVKESEFGSNAVEIVRYSEDQLIDVDFGYVDEPEIIYPPIGKTTKRKITDISIHCSATKEGIDITTSDIRRWHVQDNGWNDIGYNYIIRLDGTIEKGRPLYKSPAAVKGHNKNMLAVCYIGGIDENQVAKDTRTPQQKASMDYLIGELKRHYPEATVKGHRSYPNVAKACPSFDATEEYR